MNGKTDKRRGRKPDPNAGNHTGTPRRLNSKTPHSEHILEQTTEPCKQQYEQLVKSQDGLSAILDAAEDCIFVVEPTKFGIVLFNKAFEELVYKARGVHVQVGMRAEDIAPDRATAWNLLFGEVLAHGKARLDYEAPSVNAGFHFFAQALFLNGRVYGICVFGHDVTDQMRMEKAVRKSEEKFSKAFREGPMALSLTSLRDHRYLDVNEAFLEATGWTREEVIGRTPFDIGLWVKPEQRAEAVQELTSTGVVRNREFQFRTKAGEVRHAFGSATIFEIGEEPCMLAVTHDITDRKRTRRALEESEERLRLAIESGRMYAFEWDPESDLVQRSKQSEKILAFAEDHAHTRRELLEMLLPADKENYLRTLRSLTPENPSFSVVFRLHRSDRSLLWLEKSGRAFFSKDGKITKVVGIATDVTEIRESERALRELSGRLISTQEEERRRIARELHDHIGQELALVCVQAQRVASGKAEPDSTVQSGAQELYKRIKNIAIDVSKLSHRLHSTELDFLGLSVAAERLCRDFASQYGVAVNFESRDVPPKLDINKTRCFYRVLQEALQNVAKHSHASRVTVQLDGNNNQLILKISDDGVGFEAEKVRFESGLGLVSIRERLHLVGGGFRLTSNPGSGTSLIASVPI